MLRIFIALTLLMLVLHTGLAGSQPLYEDQLEDSADDSLELQGVQFRSGYGDVPSFGGPGSVGSGLRQDNEAKQGILEGSAGRLLRIGAGARRTVRLGAD